ncbi:MAG: hypothetical protein ACPKMZ_05280 [Pleomorphochaeta sp.]
MIVPVVSSAIKYICKKINIIAIGIAAIVDAGIIPIQSLLPSTVNVNIMPISNVLFAIVEIKVIAYNESFHAQKDTIDCNSFYTSN